MHPGLDKSGRHREKWIPVPAFAEFTVASDKPLVNNPGFAFPRAWGTK